MHTVEYTLNLAILLYIQLFSVNIWAVFLVLNPTPYFWLGRNWTHWTTKPSGSIWSTSERTSLMPLRQMPNDPNLMRNPNNMLRWFHREDNSGLGDTDASLWLKGHDFDSQIHWDKKNKSGPWTVDEGSLPSLRKTTGMVPLREEHVGKTSRAVLWTELSKQWGLYVGVLRQQFWKKSWDFHEWIINTVLE